MQDTNWPLVCASCASHILTLGSLYSFSVVYRALLFDPSISNNRASAAAVGSTATCVMLGAGVFTGALVNRLGHRSVAILGAGLLTCGLLLASISPDIPTLVLSYGVLGGWGSNLAFSPGIMLLPRHFTRHRALATGLAVSGSGIGTMLVSQALTAAISAAGWRAALTGLAFACLIVLSGAAMLYLPPPSEAAVATPSPPLRPLALSAILRHPKFYPFAASLAIYGGTLWALYAHLVTACGDWGLAEEEAATVLSVVGLSGALGRVALGALQDRRGVNKLLLLACSMSLAGVPVLLLAAFAPAAGAPLIYPAAAAFGLLSGSVVAQVPPLLGELLGMENLPLALGAQYSVQVPLVLGAPPFVGWLRGAQGSYALGLGLVGGGLVGAPLFLLPLLRAKAAENAEGTFVDAAAPGAAAESDKTVLVLANESRPSN